MTRPPLGTASVAATGRYRPYPAYKDSGVEWLGEIPAHWEVKRLKRRFRIVNGSTPKSAEPSYWDGDITWITPDDLGGLLETTIHKSNRAITRAGLRNCGTTVVPEGTIVLSTRAPIGHVAVAGVELCTNQGCRSLVFREGVSELYFFYHLLAARPVLESYGQGSTFMELSRDTLEAFVIVEPLKNEKRTIAVFLYRETAKIDALVAKNERLIELLQEKRTALITRAVTKGLDPDVPMKDSGVEWLGEIPAYWEVKRVRKIASSLQTGPFGSQLHADDYITDGIPIINPANLLGGTLVPDKDCTVDEFNSTRLEHHKLFRGDILFARRGEIGRCGLVDSEQEGWLCGTGCLRMRPCSKSIDSAFLLYLFSTAGIRGWLELESVGSTMQNLNTSIIGRMPVAIPGAGGQRAIAAYLGHETAKIDALVAKVREAIDRLKELRTALISAAVTGKIDVREAAA